jgi:hypothetical protein
LGSYAAVIGAFSLQREPHVDSAVLGASPIAIVRRGEKAVVAAGRGMRMVVTITIGLIVASLMVISVLVAVFIGFHRVMIVRPILRADQRGGHACHCDGR